MLLLICSALISGSEVAFFSLNASDLESLEENNAENERINNLLKQPEELLGTILIANNFVNVGIVILSSFLLNEYFSPENWSTLAVFLVEILSITTVLLLFGEILPKVYARSSRLSFAKLVAGFLSGIHKILLPLSRRLSKTVNRLSIESKGPSISVDDLEQALELTS
ncbi:CNNM domain-containing protein, partial [Schleiferiaceae bacterium]|nr:CNNM domain-containing protein [Schleiferiaceae bacterium]